MEKDYNRILRDWYAAHYAAKDNPEILLKAKTAAEATAAGDYCAKLMNVVGFADQDLYSLEISEDMPLPLKEHLEAEKDKGCGGCWMSSVRHRKHRDGSESCWPKINRWFNTQETLKKYASTL